MTKLFLSALILLHIHVWGQINNTPPAKPIVGASASDRKVILYWDDHAEDAEDFEGYIILRSTEPTFKEVQTITDGLGNPTFFKPIAQFDKDNEYAGPHQIAINGIKFNMGNNTGLVHIWADSGQVPGFPIRNGQMYFYAVCTYDHGDSTIGLAPKISNLDADFNFMYDDSNTVAITPNALASGYVYPELKSENRTSTGMVYLEYVNIDTREIVNSSYRIHTGDFIYPIAGPGTGLISVKIVDPSKIKDEHEYHVVFNDTGYVHQTVSYSVYDVTSGDTLIRNSEYIHSRDIQQGLVFRNEFEPIGFTVEHREWGPIFDGMSIQVFNHPEISYIDSLSGWIAGICNYESHIEFVGQQTVRIIYPADHEIRFFDHVVDSSVNGSIPTNFLVWNVTDDVKADFRFEDKDNNLALSAGDNVYPVIYVDSKIKYPCKISFLKPIVQLSGNYLNLDGMGDYAMTADNSSLDIGDESSENLTVEAWIYPEKLDGYIVSDEGFTLTTVPGKGVKFTVKGEGLIHSITKIDANFRSSMWHHVVGIFDNTTNKIAVGFDGSIFWSNEDTTTFNLHNDDQPLYVGSFDDMTGFFKGAIDEIRLSDNIRYSGEEYNPDTSYTLDGNTRGLWHFSEFAGSTSYGDTSVYENNLLAQGEAKTGPLKLISPEAGDVFLAHCTKPFRGPWSYFAGDTLAGDLFQFKTRAAYSDKMKAKMQLEDIAVIPNPYPGTASWESNPSVGRSGRKVYFIHLPQKATIRIFTISGYLVNKIEHDGSVYDGAEPWDLKSKDGKDIAYGIYIYHIDAPGVGEKIGKFAVIK